MSHFFHSRWLKWKRNHGLAHRGRLTPDFRYQPKGLIAKALYYSYFRWKEHGKDLDPQPEDS